MGSHRIKYGSVLAVAAALLLALPGLTTPANAATTARSITLAASPTKAAVSTPVTFSGKVTKSPTGSTVRIEVKSGSSWVTATTTKTTTSAGAFSVKVTLPATPATYVLRSHAAATSTLGDAVSPPVSVTALTPPKVTTTALPGGDKNLPYSATLTKTGLAGTWSVSAGALPYPLALNATTGVISGTPQGSGTVSFTVRFTETSTGLSATKALSVTLTPVPVITSPTALPDATQGTPYSATLTKTGKAGTWEILGLPAGLVLNGTTGVISGTTNAAAGEYGVYPTFTETAGGRHAFKPLSLTVVAGTVVPGDGPTVTTTSLPDGDKGLPYSATLTKTGGAGSWSLAAGALPYPLELNASTGVISGTPQGSGTATFTVRFTETATGLAGTKVLTLTTTPTPTITTPTALPDATRNAAYEVTLTKTGKAGTWSVPTGSLPAGLSLNATTGVLSGTPVAQVGDYGIYPSFTETAGGRVAFKPLSLHIGGSALAITTTSLPDAHKGAPYSVTLTKDGAAGTWASYPLPAGLTLNAATGVISGTPTAIAGDYSVYVGFTETASGQSVAKGFALHIAVPNITTTSVADGTTGTAYSKQLTATGLAGTWDYSGFLPEGVSLSATGLLSGTPTEVGDFGFSAIYTETATGITDKQALLLHVSAPGAPVITTANDLPGATIGTPYSTPLAATPTGGTWSITYGSLPVGLDLNASTGVISGTPQYAENALFIAKYTKGSTSNTKVFRLNAADPVAVP